MKDLEKTQALQEKEGPGAAIGGNFRPRDYISFGDTVSIRRLALFFHRISTERTEMGAAAAESRLGSVAQLLSCSVAQRMPFPWRDR